MSFSQGSLSRMKLPICWLSLREKVIVQKICVKLSRCDFFKNLCNEHQISNWSIVFEVIWVEVGFLKQWMWDVLYAWHERLVDYLSDVRSSSEQSLTIQVGTGSNEHNFDGLATTTFLTASSEVGWKCVKLTSYSFWNRYVYVIRLNDTVKRSCNVLFFLWKNWAHSFAKCASDWCSGKFDDDDWEVSLLTSCLLSDWAISDWKYWDFYERIVLL